MIEFECKHCLETIRLSDDKAGSSGKCPHCRKPVTVPLDSGYTLHDDAFAQADPQPSVVIQPGVSVQNLDLGAKALNLVGNITAWVFGLLFVFFFLNSVWRYPLASIPALAGAALLLPPLYKRVQPLFKTDPGVKWRVIGAVVLFVAYMMMYTSAMTDESTQRIKEKAALAEQTRKEERAAAALYFKDNKAAIMTEANELLDHGKITEAINLVRRFRGLEDADIEAVIAKADRQNKAIADEAKKTKLLETLSSLKQESVPERARVYGQLVALAPDNTEYQKKYAELKSQADKAAAKQLVDEEAAKAKALRQSMGLDWRYSNNPDEMTRQPIIRALIDSTSTLSFDFPYAGTQRATLQLRKHPRWGNDVILQIQRGQFLCGSYDGCSVTVRFGNGKPQRFAASEANDNDSTFLFIRNYSNFVSQLRKVDEVVIEASFYQAGNRAIKFSTDGLDWK